MSTIAQTSIETYLRTSYDPDAEYVDGDVEERNVGEYDHTIVRRAVLIWFYLHEREWHVRSLQEQRLRVAANKVRLPDVSIFARDLPVEQVFTRPPLIAIEVLSPEDRHARVDEKIQDYIGFGIRNVWIIDPKARKAWDCSDGDWLQREHFAMAGSPLYLSLPELFARIDEEQM